MGRGDQLGDELGDLLGDAVGGEERAGGGLAGLEGFHEGAEVFGHGGAALGAGDEFDALAGDGQGRAVEGDELGDEFAAGEDVHQGNMGGEDEVAGDGPLPAGDGEEDDHGLAVAGDLEGSGAAFDDDEVGPADDGIGGAGADIDGGIGGAEVVADLPGAFVGGGGGDEGGAVKAALDFGDDFEHGGHVGVDFRAAAAGEDGDAWGGGGGSRRRREGESCGAGSGAGGDWLRRNGGRAGGERGGLAFHAWQGRFEPERVGVGGVCGGIEHGVADVDAVDPAFMEVLLFEGEDAAEGVDGLADFFDAPGSGGPDLGGDVIADGEVLGFGDAGDAEVDGGGIDRDDDMRLLGGEFSADFAEEFPPEAALGEKGAHEHGGALDGVGEEPAAGGGHFLAADADEARIGVKAFEGVDECGAQRVAGVFGGSEEKQGNKDLRWMPGTIPRDAGRRRFGMRGVEGGKKNAGLPCQGDRRASVRRQKQVVPRHGTIVSGAKVSFQ